MLQDIPLKAVAFDLDDTLLHDDLSISPYTLDVLRRLSDEGIRIVPASGRAKLSMMPFLDLISCVSLYIACNGAEIWDYRTGRMIRQEFFSVPLAREIASYVESRGCYAHVYEGDRFFFNRHDIYAEQYAASSMLSGVFVGNLSDFIRTPRNKLLVISEEGRIAEMLPEARSLFRGKASVSCSKPTFLEFNPVNATKGNALETVSSCLGISPEEFVAFGDSLNDLSMLQRAGAGVTVANGRPEIRPFCSDVCGSNNQDGPAHYLEHLFWGKEVSA